ncbi:hypothetical protein A9Q99_06325 [Gammaproteobacteria bacterium 45_16_T64]|nr:hypothetical protein A9Q99_06325 [Gammaproteobacteria bacterium 45_16_T64]
MNVDGFTLFVIFMLISWTGVFCVGFLWASNRDIRGISHWFYSQVLYGVATVLLVFHITRNEGLQLFITNTAFFCALLLFFHGHIEFLRLKHPKPLYAFAIVGHLVFFSYFSVVDSNANARIATMSFITVILTGYISGKYWMLWRQKYQANHLFATTALTLSMLVNLARMLSSGGHGTLGIFEVFAHSPALYVCLFWTQLIQIFVFFALINSIHLNNLKHLANHDALTNTYNRRSFMETGDKLFSRFKMNDQPMALMMVDVDWFKSINDKHGHPAGDEALRSLVSTIREELRPRDMLGRYGGEEFCILLEDTNRDVATKVAERIRLAVEEKSINIGKITINMSVSIGIATLERGMQEFSDMLSYSDKALYSAKQAGRNRVVHST